MGELKVLFIGGLGRSGSTLLDRILGEIPGYQSLGEVVHLWQRGLRDDERCGSGEPFHACPYWTKVGHVAFGGWDRVDADEVIALQRSVDRTRYIPLLAAARLLPRFRKRVERYASLLGDVYRASADVSAARVLIDSSKHASTAYALRHVAGIEPVFVHLVRDPRAVAYAWTKKMARPDGGVDAQMARYTIGKSAIQFDVQNVAMAALRVASARLVHVRYEDLVADPEHVIRRILTAVGDGELELPHLSGHAVTLGDNHNIGGNPMKSATGAVTIRADEQWRAAMPRRDRLAVTALTLPVMLASGYRLRPGRGRNGRHQDAEAPTTP